MKKSTFALFFGNRGFFPASLQEGARRELPAALKELGHDCLMMDASLTRHGAVETPDEGRVYAEWLRKHQGEYDGVILCLPNFGDETGAVAALREAGVPVLIQAYPDELDKMSPELRRDAFCGKFSVMDVLAQYDVLFTSLKPHVVHPNSPAFAENMDYFDRLCRVVGGMADLTVGAIGARTTPFKTVRIDEVALQHYGVTVETFDLSAVFKRVESLDAGDAEVCAKGEALDEQANWNAVPKRSRVNLAKLGVVLDRMVEENGLDAVAIRCWTEMQEQLGISPCVLLGDLNERGIPAACEVDIGSAVTMSALRLAAGAPAACLDWNNNYGDEEDKCVLFHCGPIPSSMMTGEGCIADHAILMNAVGEGCSWGCNEGRIRSMDMTYGNMLTVNGRLEFYLGQGRFTEDPIPEEFFGCAGVAEIPSLQNVLQGLGYMGHRHHVAVAPGHVMKPLLEAMVKYLGYDVTVM